MREPFRAVAALLIFLLIVMCGQIIALPKASAYEEWRYYKVLSVTGNSTVIPVGYQVNFTLFAGVGVDSAGNFYLNNHAEDDFSDIRFVDGDGVLLDMWNQTVRSGTHVHAWVELASSLTVVLYYGNELASDTWASADSVFDGYLEEGNGLLLSMPMLEGSGSTVNDYSSYGTDGTLVGDTNWTSNGFFGSGLAFDGVGDYVNLGHVENMDFYNYPAWSVVAYASFNQTADRHTILGSAHSQAMCYSVHTTAMSVYAMGLNGSTATIGTVGSGFDVVSVVTPQWENHTFGLDGNVSVMSPYGIAFPDNAYTEWIGNYNNIANRFMNGTINGLYVIDRCLNGNELALFVGGYPYVDLAVGSLFFGEVPVAGLSVSSGGEVDSLVTDSVNELFITDGMISWIGLIAVIVVLLAIVGYKRYLIALALPITVIVSLFYLAEGLGWHFVIMILNSVFLLLEFAAKKD